MALTTCDSGHQEIVYDDYHNHRRGKCPLCEAIEERETMVATLQAIPAYTFGGGSAEAEIDRADDYYREQIESAIP